jgi:hypothetical protein
MYVYAGICKADEVSAQDRLSRKTLRQATQEGNAFGTLLLIERANHLNPPHFGHACMMQSIIKDGKFPFTEAALAFNKATQNIRKYRPELKELPISMFDLFDHHDMRRIQEILEDGWMEAYGKDNRLTLHNSCKLAFSIDNEEVVVHAHYHSKEDESELVPVITFLKDAYDRCRNCTDLVGMLDDLLHSTNLFIY